jgi:cell division protein ZapA
MSAEQQIPPRKDDLSRVTVTINGRRFRMACEQGQEAHVRRLAGDLDQRIGHLRGEFGEIGNTQLTVMAALTISDELVEMRGRLGVLERELAALQETRAAAADHARVTQSAVSAALNAAAERIEGISRRLNRTRPLDHEHPEPAHEPTARGSARENGANRKEGLDRLEKAIPSMVAAGRLSD